MLQLSVALFASMAVRAQDIQQIGDSAEREVEIPRRISRLLAAWRNMPISSRVMPLNGLLTRAVNSRGQLPTSVLRRCINGSRPVWKALVSQCCRGSGGAPAWQKCRWAGRHLESRCHPRPRSGLGWFAVGVKRLIGVAHVHPQSKQFAESLQDTTPQF